VSEFEWIQGEHLVTFYESSPGNHRGFCRICGSPIVSKFAGTRITAWRSEPWMMIPAFDLNSTYMSKAKQHGSRSRMTFRNFQSVQNSDQARMARHGR
jgi:hypothetical protein